MPIDYKKYPPNWKTEIRPAILERAKNRCEFCGIENYALGYRDIDGKFYDWKFIEDELENKGNDLFDNVLKNCFDKKGEPTEPIKIILTVAHLDHDLKNNKHENLKALCQKCHLNYDQEHRSESRKKNKNKGNFKLDL